MAVVRAWRSVLAAHSISLMEKQRWTVHSAMIVSIASPFVPLEPSCSPVGAERRLSSQSRYRPSALSRRSSGSHHNLFRCLFGPGRFLLLAQPWPGPAARSCPGLQTLCWTAWASALARSRGTEQFSTMAPHLVTVDVRDDGTGIAAVEIRTKSAADAGSPSALKNFARR